MKWILSLLVAIWLAFPAFAQDAAQVTALTRAMEAVGDKDWPAATEAAGGGGLPGELVTWHRLRLVRGGVLPRHVPFWPRMQIGPV